MSNRYRYYVGIRVSDNAYEVFSRKDNITPTADLYPQYVAVIGPHRTKRGAEFMASPAARNNPHVQTSDDADRIAKQII